MILIVSVEQDIHARHVAAILNDRGHEVQIFDTGSLGESAVLSCQINGPSTITKADGTCIDLTRARSIWMRRPRRPRRVDALTDPEARRFCQREWASTLDGLFQGLPADFVNPAQAEFSASKPHQLAVASRCGLDIPLTLITSDPQAAAEFIVGHQGDVIHKAQTAPTDRLLDTRLWRETDRNELHRLPLAPTMFQRRIHGPADVRATFVGGDIHAARIETATSRAGVDSRLDQDAQFTPCVLPLELEDRLRNFMAMLGLVYGTIDLKIDDRGHHVFLEVNPQGQFLYVEVLTGLPISQAMATLLAG